MTLTSEVVLKVIWANMCFWHCTSPCTSPYIIFVNISKMVMISRKVYIKWLIQLIKLDIFCFYDFDLRGRFKGHLGRNVGFIAYAYIIMVNNLKMVMNLRKVYITWLIHLIKHDLFCFYVFDLQGHFKGHLGKNVGFIAYSYIIIVNNLKTVTISRKVFFKYDWHN